MQNEEGVKTLLQNTLDHRQSVRLAAERELAKLMSQPGFPLLLVRLVQSPESSVPMAIRLSAAILFKNMVKKHWSPDPEVSEAKALADEEKAQIKRVIVDLMLNTPEGIKKQMAATLTIISEHDFPQRWPELLPELITRLNTNNFEVINGLLGTANSILKRYRHLAKSTEVLIELKYILETFSAPFLQLFQSTTNLISQNQTNADALKVLFTSLVYLLKIFYSLNAIDLPEFFEDNMNTFMQYLQRFLVFESSLPQIVGDEDDEKAGLLHQVQSWICRILSLYVSKYEEEFATFLSVFAKDVWSLLMKVGNQPKFDNLVIAAISFLTSISTSVHHVLFKEPQTLKELIEKIIIPNLRLREIDLELFEDSPIEYIRRDVEGSDAETRRRAATMFVKGLRKYYENQVTEICGSYINNLLGEYTKNPLGNWLAKDVATYLITALAIRGQTAALGTTNVNTLVPIVDYFKSQVVPELMNPNPPALVIKADCLKFVWTFRQQIPVSDFVQLFPAFISALESPNFVVHSYSSLCIEKLLSMRDRVNGVMTPKFGKDQLKPFLASTLTNSIKLLDLQNSKENDYVMKGIMRVISVAQEEITPLSSELMKKFSEILTRVSANPSNPSFNHYLFESIAALIKQVGEKNPQACSYFEQLLVPIFTNILNLDVQEFAPYIFQILSLLIETVPQPLNPFYINFFPQLLLAVLWERRGNVPALVRLLQAYFSKAGSQVVVPNMESILGIFINLCFSKVLDHEGFYILQALVEHLEVKDFAPFMKTIFVNIFTRLHKDKTVKFVKSFILFLCVFMGKHGPNSVIEQIESIQQDLFGNILNSLLLPYLPKLTSKVDQKVGGVGLTKLLTETQLMFSPAYLPHYANCLKVVIQLIEGRGGEESSISGINVAADDASDEIAEIEENTGFAAAYSQLAHAMKGEVDPFPSIVPQILLARNLHQVSKTRPGIIPQQIQMLSPTEQQNLMNYFRSAELSQPYVV